MEIALGVVFGLVIGYLVNYLADILPIHRKIEMPVCQLCQHERSFLGYLLLKDCAVCGRKASKRTYWVIIAAIGLEVFIILYSQKPLYWISNSLAVLFFLSVSVIDIEHRLIFNQMIIAGGILGIINGVVFYGISRTFLGGLVGYVVMLVFYLVGRGFGNWLAKRKGLLPEEALGFGDVNLAAVMGLFIGYPGVFAGLLLTILIGGVFGITVLVSSYFRKQLHVQMSMAYGPAISLAALILMLLRN